MTDTKTEKIINELKAELKAKYPDFKGIYLFGSRARGDYHEDSDYDLAIIFDKELDWRFKDEVRKIISKLMILHNVIIDNPFFNSKDISYPINPITEKIKYEGIYYE
jgi:uncharacterized protein